eukprot:1143942-Pelagomonas_calceolata.AAC.12
MPAHAMPLCRLPAEAINAALALKCPFFHNAGSTSAACSVFKQFSLPLYRSADERPEFQRARSLAALAAITPGPSGDALLAELYSPNLDVSQVPRTSALKAMRA